VLCGIFNLLIFISCSGQQNSNRWKQDFEQNSSKYKIIDGDTINRIDELGLLQGEWERLHPNGSFKCRGVYKNGFKEGLWERKYQNGNWRYQVNMKNGYQHGYSKFYYSNGNLKYEGNYKMGLKHGIIKTYYENGNIKKNEEFKSGKLLE
jgi:antitoxin component YwqK of YwqJK toxin-antitoxin module